MADNALGISAMLAERSELDGWKLDGMRQQGKTDSVALLAEVLAQAYTEKSFVCSVSQESLF